MPHQQVGYAPYPQPRVFVRDVVDRPMDAGQPHREVIAKAVHRVVGTGRGDALDRQLRPLRVLRCKQCAYEVRIGVRLIECIFITRYA